MRFIVALVLFPLLLTLCLSVSCTPAASASSTITASPFLLEQVEKGEWLLLDVRTPEEFSEGHIPGAINVPHDEIDAYLSSLTPDKDKTVVVYCRSGRRAKLAIEHLEAQQFNNVQHLEGDMLGWNEARLPVEKM
ncbi:rhodanese-like domain-containing protein [Alteromonas sp. CYL-A6]|uniref:rhodanese-like domain-containing protein n=1 Tax=Alteromonas nitratireducens TaxID=3390813 RepID=UPI0034B7568F